MAADVVYLNNRLVALNERITACEREHETLVARATTPSQDRRARRMDLHIQDLRIAREELQERYTAACAEVRSGTS